MKFIYISPFKSQNITNFTFWKVILLEIHEVHLIQGNQVLGTTSETATSSSFPQMKVLFNFPLNLDRDDLNPGRSESTFSKSHYEAAHPNIWALPNIRKKITCLQSAPSLLAARHLQFLVASGERPEALSLTISATNQQKVPHLDWRGLT